jgi:serine phosphatase RsbU (regulator of sigma subunit)
VQPKVRCGLYDDEDGYEKLAQTDFVEVEKRRWKGMDKSFVTKVGETISAKGKEVTDKAKELAEIANLRSQINTCEEVVKKNYMEIGRRYYEQHGSEPDEFYEEQCRAVRNAQTGIADLEEKIKELKGI